MLRACVFSNTSTKTSACIMCKDSLLSLKTKLIVFSVEEMCGTIRTSDVQMCNIVTELETLSREVWVLCSMEKSLSLNKNRRAVSQFSIFLYVKCQFIKCTISKLHAFGCRQISVLYHPNILLYNSLCTMLSYL